MRAANLSQGLTEPKVRLPNCRDDSGSDQGKDAQGSGDLATALTETGGTLVTAAMEAGKLRKRRQLGQSLG